MPAPRRRATPPPAQQRKARHGPRKPTVAASKDGLHPRNRHRGRYDFRSLVEACPALERCIIAAPDGGPTIDFGDPVAVKLLNGAILNRNYGVVGWDLPTGFLCPPIPGRADYLHYVADLLAEGAADGLPPRGAAIRVLDVGVGANAVYPLIGHREYGWSFVGTDTNPDALASAQRILAANPAIAKAVELRHQRDPQRILDGLVGPEERFDLLICNPPFHPSAQAAAAGTRRKVENLGLAQPGTAPVLNFGGQPAELCYPGGEVAFINRLIQESARRPQAVRWYTTLVAKGSHVAGFLARLAVVQAQARVISMEQGHKRSRLVAWTFPTAPAAVPPRSA